jgi:hypothetical protein
MFAAQYSSARGGNCNVQTSVSRVTSRVVSLVKKATGDHSEPAVQRGEGGFADWLLVTIHALREFESSAYRALLDELSAMGDVVGKLDLEPGELPDFTTVCARYQALKMGVWRALLRHSAGLVQPGEFMRSTQPGSIEKERADTTRIERITDSRRSSQPPLLTAKLIYSRYTLFDETTARDADRTAGSRAKF